MALEGLVLDGYKLYGEATPLTNYVTNPRLETLDGWSQYQGTYDNPGVSGAPVPIGGRNTKTATSTYLWTAWPFVLASAGRWLFSCWVFNETGNAAAAQLSSEGQLAGSTFVGSSNGSDPPSTTANGTWQRLWYIRDVAAGDLSGSMFLIRAGAPTSIPSGNRVYWTAAQITKLAPGTTTPPKYFDGSTVDATNSYGSYNWAGVPNDSVSVPAPRLMAFDSGSAAKNPEWAERADRDGSTLVRAPLLGNRTVTARLEFWSADRDSANAAVRGLVAKLKDADGTERGLPLVWTPADGSRSLTFYVLTGEITELPIEVAAGYFASTPILSVGLSLSCKPHGYGAEYATAVTSASTPVVEMTISGVPGDDDAEARLVVGDAAAQARNYVAWGLALDDEQGYLFHTTDMTVTGFAGTSTTRAGSHGANVFRATLTGSPLAVCGTGAEAHVGSYRVMCRYWASGLGVRLRFAYRVGDGQLAALLWAAPPAEDGWCETDLGVVAVGRARTGTQQWRGQVEAYTDTPGDTLDVDMLELVPVDRGYGKARLVPRFESSTTFSARDEFLQASGVLTGKTAPVGGVWAGAGDATDFAVGTPSAVPTVQRIATADTDLNTGRYVVANATLAAQVVQADFRHNRDSSTANTQESGVLARYVDTSNWLRAVVRSVSGYRFEVQKRVGGTVSVLFGSDAIPFQPYLAWYTIRLQIDAAGRWACWYFPRDSSPGLSVAQGQDTALATGGALASGKPGLYDANTGATTTIRQFDNFLAFVPTADAVIHPSRTVVFGHDETVRYDPTGVFTGRPYYRGADFFVPPAGSAGHVSRVAVMARRTDIETSPSVSVADSTSLQVYVTPRYLVVP